MRVVKNEAFVKRRVKFTQRGSLIGMGLLLVSLVLSSRSPEISWLFLLTGFVVAMTSVRVGNRYVRPPRPDVVLDKVLKGLDNRYVLYHYYHPAEHLLLTPSGLIALRMQQQRGEVSVRGARWRHGPLWQRLRVLLGDVGVGNPAAELRRTLAEMRKALAGLQIEGSEVPLEGAIVFFSGKTRLDVQDAEFPVLLAEDLKVKIRAMAEAHPALPGRTHKALAAALRGEG